MVLSTVLIKYNSLGTFHKDTPTNEITKMAALQYYRSTTAFSKFCELGSCVSHFIIHPTISPQLSFTWVQVSGEIGNSDSPVSNGSDGFDKEACWRSCLCLDFYYRACTPAIHHRKALILPYLKIHSPWLEINFTVIEIIHSQNMREKYNCRNRGSKSGASYRATKIVY